MKKSLEELWKEGEEIARKLGNGVAYRGPQMWNDKKFEFHLFNDSPTATDTSFSAKTFKQAKRKLIEKRKLFGMPLPNF